MMVFIFLWTGIHDFKRSTPPVNHSDKTAKPLDPIPPVADSIRDETFLLCFDEFQVKGYITFYIFIQTLQRY